MSFRRQRWIVVSGDTVLLTDLTWIALPYALRRPTTHPPITVAEFPSRRSALRVIGTYGGAVRRAMRPLRVWP